MNDQVSLYGKMGVRGCMRVQVDPTIGFGLDQLHDQLGYFRQLGLDVYLSPPWATNVGSSHGYDQTNPNAIDPARGGIEGFRRMSLRAKALGLGVIVDWLHYMSDNPGANVYWSDPSQRCRIMDIDRDDGALRGFLDFRQLVGINLCDPAVRQDVTVLLRQLIADGLVHGLRMDSAEMATEPRAIAQWLGELGIPIWFEAFMPTYELLGPIAGSTGYEFLNTSTRLLSSHPGQQMLLSRYQQFTGQGRTFGQLVDDAADVHVVTSYWPEILRCHKHLQDATVSPMDIAKALRLFRQRTYIDPDTGEIRMEDRRLVEAARAAGMHPAIARALLLETADRHSFVRQFQELILKVIVRGVLAANYRISANIGNIECGLDPHWTPLSADAFHEDNELRLKHAPLSMVADSNHDTNLSADVRGRFIALTYMADEWWTLVETWHDLNAAFRTGGAPDKEDENRIYQALLGGWPLPIQSLGADGVLCPRLEDYLVKCIKERRQLHNWWTPPAEMLADQARRLDEAYGADRAKEDRQNFAVAHNDYEEALRHFLRSILAHQPFMESFTAFQEKLEVVARRIRLVQLLLKCMVPGKPDIYQGDDLWYRAFVDPDNRLAVDWDLRNEVMRGFRSNDNPLPVTMDTAKMKLIMVAMDVRQRHPDDFLTQYGRIATPPGVLAFSRGPDVQVWVAVDPSISFGGEQAIGPGADFVNVVKDITDLGAPVALFERVCNRADGN